jgi:hypothetical protein
MQARPWGAAPREGVGRHTQRFRVKAATNGITEIRTLSMAAKKGPIVVFCMPKKTKCILLVSTTHQSKRLLDAVVKMVNVYTSASSAVLQQSNRPAIFMGRSSAQWT